MTRFSVLRLCHMNKLVVKEPNDPCVILLKPSDPLSDAQLRRLVLATPWAPVMVEAEIEGWNASDNTFNAQIESIETIPKIPQPLKPKRKCDAKKQHSRIVQL